MGYGAPCNRFWTGPDLGYPRAMNPLPETLIRHGRLCILRASAAPHRPFPHADPGSTDTPT